MRRSLIKRLNEWKKLPKRKPLLIDGARQTGKTYLAEKIFGAESFTRVHKFDFREDRALHRYFEAGLAPQQLIRNLELLRGRDIALDSDLIFFDEVGECQGAVDSLKYFCEKMPHIFLIASGSNIGLLDSFPVGKVQIENLFPLTFEEFLIASEENDLIKAFEQRSRLLPAHDRLWAHLLDYYFVGGMPEAVDLWFTSAKKGTGINERTRSVRAVHKNLIEGYYRDFGKYSGKVNALHIEAVFNNIPIQLARTLDDSVRRYAFKDVIAKKNRYLDLATPIEWLCKTKLATKNYVIDCQPRSPLKSLIKPNIFKLFFFDVGLLGNLLEISYREQLAQSMSFKGFIAENFVQCELIAQGATQTYSWSERNSEIEFIHKSKVGELIPIEVKSGKRTRAKSLVVYCEKYAPTRTIKLVGSAGGSDDGHIVWPLYFAKFIADI
ncbi:MAG: ATP-binding protein [Deltaproteobacteria bacterium]|nr:ATP-binding protein [Deltaproteobacteria bacterium]